MSSKKSTGAYYTPKTLASFLTKHIFEKYLINRKQVRILEPSAGDGVFLRALKPYLAERKSELDIVDINLKELTKAKEVLKDMGKSISVNTHKIDFLDFPKENYSLVIGNPPYISKKHLSKKQIEKCAHIFKKEIKGTGEVKNIWPAFLIKGIQKLEDNGILCYVLPSELLQVNYTRGLRKYILDTFQRIEIFAFSELIFENVEQDVIVLIGVKKHKVVSERGVSFYQVAKLDDLKIPGYTQKNFNVHREKLEKWTNYILSDSSLSVVDEVTKKLQLKTIKYYCDKTEVGIVTAANNYFILKDSEVERLRLKKYATPILQKSSLVPNSIVISKSTMRDLRTQDKAVNLILFDEPVAKLNKSAKAYIKSGEGDSFGKLNKRHKMKLRSPWFSIPSVWISEGVFVKRSHLFARIMLNEAKVNVTDSFYRVVTKKEYDIRCLIFSFFNSLTLALTELEGRFYGGGVLELTPSEFKNLLIPYRSDITKKQFETLSQLLSSNAPLEMILNFTDPFLLQSCGTNEIAELRNIRTALFERRTKIKKSR